VARTAQNKARMLADMGVFMGESSNEDGILGHVSLTLTHNAESGQFGLDFNPMI